MILLAIALIAAGLAGFAIVVVREFRATRPTVADDDWIAPHAAWLDDHEVEREFWAIVDYQQEVP